jgi:hypothetical protein
MSHAWISIISVTKLPLYGLSWPGLYIADCWRLTNSAEKEAEEVVVSSEEACQSESDDLLYLSSPEFHRSKYYSFDQWHFAPTWLSLSKVSSPYMQVKPPHSPKGKMQPQNP